MANRAKASAAESITNNLRNLTRMPKRNTTANVTPIRGFNSFGSNAKASGKWRAESLPEITETEIRFLKALISDYGVDRVAGWMAVSSPTVLRIAAGIGFKCRPDTMMAVRKFFAEADLESAKRGQGQKLPAIGRDSPQKRGSKTNGKREAASK